jgi:hypothetical protein
MQKRQYVVVVPVGPNTELQFLNDTLKSVFTFCRRDVKIVLIDNTAHGLRDRDIHRTDDIDVLRCESEKGANPLYGGLYFNLSKAFRFALERYDFEVLLRLDDDALLIGSGADQQALWFFRHNPRVGCLGSYRFTCIGTERDFTPPRNALRQETSVRGMLRNRHRWAYLRHLRALARQNGYEDGEHCLGAVTFFSRACVERFAALGFLERKELVTSRLGEDHIFGMMVVAAGFKIEDFATEGRPLGLAWKGLPASPADLIGMGKKIVHSVKFFDDMDQGTIRAEFRRLLAQSG